MLKKIKYSVDRYQNRWIQCYSDRVGARRAAAPEIEAAGAHGLGHHQQAVQRSVGQEEGAQELHPTNHALYGCKQGRLMQCEL